ncbi:MAG TPA: hypothetical protein VFH83_12175 [Spirochaetia bacterium]|nr:hypothetical protein [Spirochaetia bacterium]
MRISRPPSTSPRNGRAVPIALRVNLLIVVSLVLGMGVGVTWLALTQYTAAVASTDTALRRQSQIVYYSIKNLMLPGEAPIARSFVGDIQLNAGLSFELTLYRRDGVQTR